MFDLVDRVEDYPQFSDWCAESVAAARRVDLPRSTIRIAYRGIQSQFSTVNQKEIPYLMLIHLREGPFTTLEGRWRFTALGDTACKVEFHLHYEFSSRMLAKVLGPVFNYIADSFVESFVKRARQIYGG